MDSCSSFTATSSLVLTSVATRMMSQDPGLGPGQHTEINIAEATTTNPVLQTVGLMNAKILGFELRMLARQVAHTGNSPESSCLIMRILSVHSPPQLRAGRGRWC